jgi:CBS domain-containing protein
MQAHEFMSCPPVTVDPKTCVGEAARIMADHRVGCVLVVDEAGNLRGIVAQGVPVGIVARHDFLRLIASDILPS